MEWMGGLGWVGLGPSAIPQHGSFVGLGWGAIARVGGSMGGLGGKGGWLLWLLQLLRWYTRVCTGANARVNK